VQITGVLVLAAGVPRAFDGDFAVVTAGYVVMRVAMVGQWLRELAVPVWAERATGSLFHREHIVERYGLFTLIVLGESILAASNAIRAGLDVGHDVPALVSLAFAGLVIVFALWWLYFDHPAQELLTSLRASMTWGYGHYLVFASVAAVGAGLEVAVDYDLHESHLPSLAAAMTVTVPVAVYLLVVWVLQVRPAGRGPVVWAFPIAAVLVLAASFGPAPIHVTAGLLALLVAVVVTTRRPTEELMSDAGPQPA
jgi:low temperature requirement protein LtrA